MQCEVFLLFVDFEKAFDRVKWSSIWNTLYRKGVPGKIIEVIKCLYTDSSCRVLHRGQLSEPVPVTAGVKQGCLLSPLLFLMVFDDVMCRVAGDGQRGLPWKDKKVLEDIDFADDLCLISTTREDLQSKADDLSREAAKEGLRVNCSKTKEMRLNNTDAASIKVNGETVERVEQFTYLGSVMSPQGGTESDVEARINKARAAFGRLKPVWRSSIISRRTKIRIFDSNVKSVLLYGCETWFVKNDIANRLQVFVNKCLRQILKVFWPRTISNTELWRLTDQKPIVTEIWHRKWRWIGHTLRRSDDHIPKQALQWQLPGKRKRGRPKTTWQRSVERDIQSLGMSWQELEVAAQDRPKWKNMLRALCP